MNHKVFNPKMRELRPNPPESRVLLGVLTVGKSLAWPDCSNPKGGVFTFSSVGAFGNRTKSTAVGESLSVHLEGSTITQGRKAFLSENLDELMLVKCQASPSLDGIVRRIYFFAFSHPLSENLRAL